MASTLANKAAVCKDTSSMYLPSGTDERFFTEESPWLPHPAECKGYRASMSRVWQDENFADSEANTASLTLLP